MLLNFPWEYPWASNWKNKVGEMAGNGTRVFCKLQQSKSLCEQCSDGFTPLTFKQEPPPPPPYPIPKKRGGSASKIILLGPLCLNLALEWDWNPGPSTRSATACSLSPFISVFMIYVLLDIKTMTREWLMLAESYFVWALFAGIQNNSS